jgi:hypothetical protein
MNEKLNKILWIPRGILIFNILAFIYVDIFSASFNMSHLVFNLIKLLVFVIFLFLSFKAPIWFGVLLLFLCLARFNANDQTLKGQDIVFVLSNFIAGCLFILLPLFFKTKERKID